MAAWSKIFIVAAALTALVAVTKGDAIASYLLSAEQEHFIQDLNPAVQNPFRHLISEIEARGWSVIITSGYRSFAEQAYLVLMGDTSTAPGHSMHNYGLAIDINITKGTAWLKKASAKAAWEDSGIPALAESLGFVWGGRFSQYDPVHFALPVMEINQLYQLAVNTFGTDPDYIYGNQLPLAA